MLYFCVDPLHIAARKGGNADARQIFQRCEGVRVRRFFVEDSALPVNPAPQCIDGTLAFFDARPNNQALIFLQPASEREQAVTHLSFQLFCNPADLRQQFEIFFSQPIFNRSLSHQVKRRSNSRLTKSDGFELK